MLPQKVGVWGVVGFSWFKSFKKNMKPAPSWCTEPARWLTNCSNFPAKGCAKTCSAQGECLVTRKVIRMASMACGSFCSSWCWSNFDGVDVVWFCIVNVDLFCCSCWCDHRILPPSSLFKSTFSMASKPIFPSYPPNCTIFPPGFPRVSSGFGTAVHGACQGQLGRSKQILLLLPNVRKTAKNSARHSCVIFPRQQSFSWICRKSQPLAFAAMQTTGAWIQGALPPVLPEQHCLRGSRDCWCLSASKANPTENERLTSWKNDHEWRCISY